MQGHHPDYSKPLEVEWLCPRCHGARHVGRERISKAPPSALWTVPEAARLAGVTRETMHRWIKSGRLEKYRLAGVQPALVRRDALAKLLKPEKQ